MRRVPTLDGRKNPIYASLCRKVAVALCFSLVDNPRQRQRAMEKRRFVNSFLDTRVGDRLLYPPPPANPRRGRPSSFLPPAGTGGQGPRTKLVQALVKGDQSSDQGSKWFVRFSPPVVERFLRWLRSRLCENKHSLARCLRLCVSQSPELGQRFGIRNSCDAEMPCRSSSTRLILARGAAWRDC